MSNSLIVPANTSGIIPSHMLREIATRARRASIRKAALGTLGTIELLRSTIGSRGTSGESGSALLQVYDAKNGTDRPGTKARFDGEAPTGDKVVDNAYDFTGAVRTFYKEVHGRNSIDNLGMNLISTVHFDSGFNNAYWDGTQMTYGDGDGQIFGSFVILDVTGHECTHGVTQFESGLVYQDQPGALNESHSDVFGKLVEAYSKKQSVDKIDWVLGRGIFMPSIKGEGIRNMMFPGTAYDDPQLGKDPQPADMAHLYTGGDDNGGVHYNSGIINRAFALAATDIGGYAWEKAGHIWYAARAASGSSPSFAQFANATIAACGPLGFGSVEGSLKKAWTAVGVTPAA